MLKDRNNINSKVYSTLTKLLEKDDKNVIFERSVSGNTLNGFLFDCIFLLIFIVLPFLLSSFRDWLPSVDGNTLYIVNFAILAIVYPAGFFLYWKMDSVGLKRNGGIAFFVGLFLFGLLRPIIGVLINVGGFESVVSSAIQIVISDLFRILSIIIILKISTPLRLDIKYVLTKKLPVLVVIALAFIGFHYMVSPIFNVINSALNPVNQEASNQVSIESTLSSQTFSNYWIVFSIVIFAPIFEELVYRHGIMVIMRTSFMKIFVPTLYFAGIHVVRGFASQDFTHIFLYLGASLVLTVLHYMKRNITYSISTHNILNIISFL